MREDAPRPVIEPPLVLIQPCPVRLHCLDYLLRYLGRAGGGIFEIEQFPREAVEIVDRARSRHGRHCGRSNEPVRGHDEDRAGSRQHLPKRPPGTREAVEL